MPMMTDIRWEHRENFNADTDTVVTPEVKNFDGFTAPEKQQVTVEGDGRTTVIYRYTRNVHTLTLKNYDGKTDKTVEARYEMSIPKPTKSRLCIYRLVYR